MLNFKKWFSKGDDEDLTITPKEITGKFLLTVDNIELGVLEHKNGMWSFKYTNEFKENNSYKPIVGFPDINKIYTRETLWPFFLIRIPGLKQPSISEIIRKEKINPNNEVALLTRFGKRTIANPYELSPL